MDIHFGDLYRLNLYILLYNDVVEYYVTCHEGCFTNVIIILDIYNNFYNIHITVTCG